MTHPLIGRLDDLGLASYATILRERLTAVENKIAGGDRKGKAYLEILEKLPDVVPASVDLNRGEIRIGRPDDIDAQQRQALTRALQGMVPWRKGPFDIFGIQIDSEWVSSLKWDRVRPHLAPLKDRRVLDIGSSCGYYMFRMAAEEPALVLGIEPYLTFYFQYQLLQHYIRADRLFTLPLRLEVFPMMPGRFDTVFCMGILYHQRDALGALQTIRRLLRSGGQLILETLILAESGDAVLEPRGRYARMNNVHAIPTVARLERWLREVGFGAVRCVDVSPTTLDEQRPTAWINSASLDAFLDPADPTRTVEGHPAPVRAVLLAYG